MANDNRQSLTQTLEQRYSNQREGGAFEIKKVLGNPGTSPKAGSIIDASSLQGASFQTLNGFEVKATQTITQMLDAAATNGPSGGGKSKQLSRYMRGFDNRKYHR